MAPTGQFRTARDSTVPRVPQAISTVAAPKATQDKHLHGLTHLKQVLPGPAELHTDAWTGDRRRSMCTRKRV